MGRAVFDGVTNHGDEGILLVVASPRQLRHRLDDYQVACLDAAVILPDLHRFTRRKKIGHRAPETTVHLAFEAASAGRGFFERRPDRGPVFLLDLLVVGVEWLERIDTQRERRAP